MVNRDMLEWLGVTWADLLVYLALAAVTAMFFLSDPIAELSLAVTGVTLAIAACPLGMKRDPDVSRFTNDMKLVSYPLCVLLVAGVVVVHYTWFNN